MNKFHLAVLLLTFSFITKSQEFIILKNGKTIEFKKYNFKDEVIEVKTRGQGKIELKKEDVYGYYSLKDEEEYVLKYDTLKNYRRKWISYYFAKRIIEGEIKVYNYTTSSTGAGPTGYAMTTSHVFSYLEKGDKYESIPGARFEKGIILKSFVEDDQKLLKRIEDEDYKINENELTEIVKEYNLSKYQDPTGKNGKKSMVYFYIKNTNDIDETLKLQINEKDYELHTSAGLPVNLYTDYSNKVCLVVDDESHCEILKASPYFIKYINIAVDQNKIEFNAVDSKVGKHHMSWKYRSQK